MPAVLLDIVSDIFSLERGGIEASNIFVLNPLGDFASYSPSPRNAADVVAGDDNKLQIFQYEWSDSIVRFFLQLLPRRFDLPEDDKGQQGAKKPRNAPITHQMSDLEGLKGLSIVTEEPLRGSSDSKCVRQILDELGLELEQEVGEVLLEKKKPGVRFDETVSVSYVSSFRDLDEEIRCAIWESLDDLGKNASRNAKEFISDGGDWRFVTEEEDMVHDDVTGELLHPATWADIHFRCRKQVSETKGKRRGGKGDPPSSPGRIRGKRYSLLHHPRSMISFAA